MQIRALREARGLAQWQLAKSMGTVRSAISNWESGTSLPKTKQLPQLADVLHCSIDELFGREPVDSA